jgi:hypothetical protein
MPSPFASATSLVDTAPARRWELTKRAIIRNRARVHNKARKCHGVFVERCIPECAEELPSSSPTPVWRCEITIWTVILKVKGKARHKIQSTMVQHNNANQQAEGSATVVPTHMADARSNEPSVLSRIVDHWSKLLHEVSTVLKHRLLLRGVRMERATRQRENVRQLPIIKF